MPSCRKNPGNDQHDTDDAVYPVVVRGGHDNGESRGWMNQDEPPPPGPENHDDADRDNYRPADMQRWHGRELVGHGVGIAV
jgi:hypothetical protein